MGFTYNLWVKHDTFWDFSSNFSWASASRNRYSGINQFSLVPEDSGTGGFRYRNGSGIVIFFHSYTKPTGILKNCTKGGNLVTVFSIA